MSNLSLLQKFPSDFIFGVATSSYQIEGNAYGGCGKSIWDDFAQRRLNGIDGQKACNHYSFFKEDIKLIKEEGTNIYDLFKYKNIIITSSSAKKIQQRVLNEKN